MTKEFSIFSGFFLLFCFVFGGLSATSAQEDNVSAPFIQDIRIGDRNNQSRIVLFCESDCPLKKINDSTYFLPGANDQFEFDVSSESDRLTKISARPEDTGSTISIAYEGTLENAKQKECQIAGRRGVCLDIFFQSEKSEIQTDTPVEKLVAGEEGPRPTDPPADVTPPDRPMLRETASVRLKAFLQLQPPERLDPPETPILAKVQPIEENISVETPKLRQDRNLAGEFEVDVASRIENILGKDLTPPYCNNAEATLQTDAWALSAMVDVGLCAAARGDVVEGEAILSRLLEYTPDNFEALIGRAIIAEQAGERGAALRYYQEALDAAPPVEESRAIVAAMAFLKNDR